MTSNHAAYQPAKKAPKLQVSEAPYPRASDGQLVVRAAAVAINPIDWVLQDRGDVMYTHLKYPFTFGYDLAGQVVEAGKGVTRFQVGDRVTCFCIGGEKEVNSSSKSAFQQFVLVDEDLASEIPEAMTFEQASVLPLALATATTALFDKSQLGLNLPTEPKQPSSGKTVLIWGGSTSVGCNAIQLAAAAGYEVFTTASPKNFKLLEGLGATKVWDYRSPTVANNIVQALRGKSVAGSVSIGTGSAQKCIQIMSAASGQKHVSMVSFPVSQEAPQNFVILRTVVPFIWAVLQYKIQGMLGGVKSSFVSITPIFSNGISKYIFTDFLPKALQAGTFKAAPEPQVVGTGLEAVQTAFDLQKQGVSAKKLVVTL